MNVQQGIQRAPTGHVAGESHYRVQHPDRVVRKARRMRETDGISYASIAHILSLELGLDVDNGEGISWLTVRDWCTYRTRRNA